MRLTKRSIDTLAPTSADYITWDDTLKGFGVRVWPSGRKVFLVRYRTPAGKQRHQNLGAYPPLTPERARREATHLLATKDDTPSSVTVADLAQRYMREYARYHKKASTVGEDERLLRVHILPALGRMLAVRVKREHVAALHQAMFDRPYTANRCLSVLSKIFSLAREWDICTDNPVRHIRRYREHHRERFLTRTELHMLMDAIKEMPQPAQIGMTLLLLTGARLGEVANLTWDEVDFEHQCLRLRDSKTGPKVIYLSSQATTFLRSLPHPTPYVLGSRIPYYSAFKSAWGRLRKRIGLRDVRLHDLRHTYASLAASNGIPLRILGEQLGHKRVATTERYAHLMPSAVREAVEHIGQLISSDSNPSPTQTHPH